MILYYYELKEWNINPHNVEYLDIDYNNRKWQKQTKNAKDILNRIVVHVTDH